MNEQDMKKFDEWIEVSTNALNAGYDEAAAEVLAFVRKKLGDPDTAKERAGGSWSTDDDPAQVADTSRKEGRWTLYSSLERFLASGIDLFSLSVFVRTRP